MFQIKVGETLKSVKADLTAWTRRDQTSNQYYLVVIECKFSTCEAALAQAVACLKGAFNTNNDGETVYGFCTTAKWFTFLSYNPLEHSDKAFQGFRYSKEMNFLFPRMVEPEYKGTWLAQNVEVVGIIFSVLCDKLKISRD